MTKRSIGLALGGGGARGLAHLGVLLELQSAGIPVSCIAGSSMGAAIGAACAVGADLALVAGVLSSLNLNELLQISDSTARELQKIIRRSMVEYVRGTTWEDEEAPPHDLERLRELFRLLTAGRRFDDVMIPFAAVATDLQTGEAVVLRSGRLCDALVASTAVPGVFSPVAMDGRLLVDGGVVNKLPADVVADLGADVVIAVDTGAPVRGGVSTCLDAVLQAQRITSQHLTELQLRRSDERLQGALLILRPAVCDIRMFGFIHAERAIQAGRDVARSHLDLLRQLIGDTPRDITSN